MKKVIIVLALTFCCPLTMLAKKHAFNAGLYWELNNGILTISGNGDMPNDFSIKPWNKEGIFEKVIIKEGVTSIGKVAFSDCTRLKSVVIPNSIQLIGQQAFSGCTSLRSVVIPNSVQSIGEYAFDKCTNLQSVVIPNSVSSIEIYEST